MSLISEANALFGTQMYTIIKNIATIRTVYKNIINDDGRIVSVEVKLAPIKSSKQEVVIHLSEGKWLVNQGQEPIKTYSHFEVISTNEFRDSIEKMLN